MWPEEEEVKKLAKMKNRISESLRKRREKYLEEEQRKSQRITGTRAHSSASFCFLTVARLWVCVRLARNASSSSRRHSPHAGMAWCYAGGMGRCRVGMRNSKVGKRRENIGEGVKRKTPGALWRAGGISEAPQRLSPASATSGRNSQP